MATGLKAKTFTLVNSQASGTGALNTTLYTCPADKYAKVTVAYTSTGNNLNISAYRAIPSGFSNGVQMVGGVSGTTVNFERADGSVDSTVTGSATADEPSLFLNPGDKIVVQQSSGSYEYRVAIEEISAY